MNWEVNSMPLKTSFFNSTLFGKNLSRSWPLWGGVTALGSLLPLYLLLALNSRHSYVHFDQTVFVDFLYTAAVYFLPMFTAWYAILVAMFVWSYLHNARSVGMMHSLAIDRTGLFVTTTLSGLAMLLIPYVVVGGLMCVIATCCGAMHIGAVLSAIAAVLLENLLFFGMATLCAAVTGSVIATAVYYIILNVAVPVLDALITLLAAEFIFGLSQSSSEWSILFSPVISLYDNVDVVYRNADGVSAALPEIEGFGLIAAYGVVGIAMLAASFLLYRKRRSESAGDVVAFPWLRPVFRFGVAVASSLTLGRVLYELLWASVFSAGRYADILPMAACMMVGAVVGYYAASMLLEKSLRVFRGSLKGAGIVCAVTAALCLAVSLDLFGVERYVPRAENVDRVAISGHLDIVCDAEKFPNLCEDIIALHQAIVADKSYIRRDDDGSVSAEEYLGEEYLGENYVRWRSFSIEYTLKNGATVERFYYLPLTESRMKDPSTYDGKLLAIASSPDVLLATVTIPEAGEFVHSFVESYNPEYEFRDLDKADWGLVYDALQRDARESNFILNRYFWEDLLKQEPTVSADTAYLYVQYRVREGGDSEYYAHFTIHLQPTMTHTLRALVAAGVLDQATVDSWGKPGT